MDETEISIYSLSEIFEEREIGDEENGTRDTCDPSVSGSDGLDVNSSVDASDELPSSSQLAEFGQSYGLDNSDGGLDIHNEVR